MARRAPASGGQLPEHREVPLPQEYEALLHTS